MVPLTDLLIVVRSTLAEWLRVRWSDLHFAAAPTTALVLVVVVSVAVLMMLAREMRRRQAGRRHVALPAVLPIMERSALVATRHTPFLLFVAGLVFFAVALADPRTAFVREEVTYPGRRIAMLIDGSASMVLRFEARRLGVAQERAFYTAVAAAEHFLKLRMNGPYRDLLALIQFGNESYVVTPFTTDYENAMLSLKLIATPQSWGTFNDVGTTIIRGLEQSTNLFKTFNFLNTSGNLILVFTDGSDDETRTISGRSLDDLLAEARSYEIPIYMIRIGFNKKVGEIQADTLWKSAMERTGGRFYAASDEPSLMRAISEIDRVSAGRIDVRHYSSERPRFAGYALVAVALWLVAAVLKLGFPYFRTFP